MEGVRTNATNFSVGCRHNCSPAWPLDLPNSKGRLFLPVSQEKPLLIQVNHNFYVTGSMKCSAPAVFAFLFFSPNLIPPSVCTSAPSPSISPRWSGLRRRFTGKMKWRNTLFFQDDLMTFRGIPVTAEIFRNYSI